MEDSKHSKLRPRKKKLERKKIGKRSTTNMTNY